MAQQFLFDSKNMMVIVMDYVCLHVDLDVVLK